ncbi:MAG: DUF4012 domain-containing protein [Patescibacteria group bacterium]|jgi:hypothetical protein
MFNKKKVKKINFLDGHDRFEKLLEHLPFVKKKKKNHFLVFLKYFFYTLILFLVLGIIAASFLAYKGKGIYDLVMTVKYNLDDSLSAAKEKNFTAMSESAAGADENIRALVGELEMLKKNFFLKNTGLADKELVEIEKILKSAELSSRSLVMAAALGQELDNVVSGRLGGSFSEFSSEEKQRLLKFIYESGPEINGLKANLDLALLDLENVSVGGLLSPLRPKIEETREKMRSAATFLDKMMFASRLVPEIFGYPKNSTFLVLFQNSDELRPTGGFLGTYGILETKDGDIARFDTHDIYHMDMPLEAANNFKIVPPEPIKKYLNKNWYLRDANWSPDWPESAKQILWFYQKEDALLPPQNKINNFSGNFNGVFAITPDLVTSFLELTGPLTIKDETYSKENFTRLLEYKVEEDFAGQNTSSWERKEIIGDILAEIKIRMFNLPYDKWFYAWQKIDSALERKDLLLYFQDPILEDLAKNLGAAGEVKTVDDDYLLVVDANMAALKTDAAMERTLEYKIEKKSDGLYAKLKINYQNNGVRDWRTDDYKSYTRIYAPKGSEFVSASGFSYEKAITSEDLDKTVFEGFVIVRVGQSVSLNLEYKLPPDLLEKYNQGRYSLYLQKQPGKKVKNVKVDVMASGAIKSYEPLAGATVNSNNIVWNSDLDTDKEFRVIINYKL